MLPGGRTADRILLAVTAGVAWALAAPPRGWVLLPLGVAALSIALHECRWRPRCLLGLVAGAVLHVPTLWWLNDFSVPGYVVVVLLQTILLALATTLVPAARTGRWSGGWWGLPAALVLLEAAQARFPLGGFPLPGLALTQPDGPFAAAAPLGGSLLVTGVAAVSGVALAALVTQKGARAKAAVAGGALAVSVAPLALAPLVGGVVATRPAGTLEAVIVQGGGPRGLRAVFSDPEAVTDRHLAVAEQVSGSPDLVLLPEDVVTLEGPVAGSTVDERVGAVARRAGAAVVVGVVETAGSRFRNAAVLWGPDGRILDRYEKEHRVPFGEYMPARSLLERITGSTALVPRDAAVGKGEALLRSPRAPLGVVISYEVFFADRAREAITAGGQLLLVPTNAASYVGEKVPAVEVAAARLRAREFGRTVLQAAPTGYSAVVLPDGDLTARSALGTPALIRAEVPLRTGLTPYASTGDAPVLALAGALLIAVPLVRAAANRRHRRSWTPGRGSVRHLRPAPLAADDER